METPVFRMLEKIEKRSALNLSLRVRGCSLDVDIGVWLAIRWGWCTSSDCVLWKVAFHLPNCWRVEDLEQNIKALNISSSDDKYLESINAFKPGFPDTMVTSAIPFVLKSKHTTPLDIPLGILRVSANFASTLPKVSNR